MTTKDEIFEQEMNAAFGVILSNRYKTNAELQRFKQKANSMARAAARKRYAPETRKPPRIDRG